MVATKTLATASLLAMFTWGCSASSETEVDQGNISDPNDDGPDETDPGPTTAGEDSVTKVINADIGGTLEIGHGPFAGLRFTVPPGALAEDTEITIRPGEANTHGQVVDFESNPEMAADVVTMMDEMIGHWENPSHFGVALAVESARHTGLMPVGTELVLEPSGLEFSIPAVLELPYSHIETDGPIEGAANWLTVVHVSDDKPTRLLIPRVVDTASGRLTVDIEHFSEVGIIDFFKRLGEQMVQAEIDRQEMDRAVAEATYDGLMKRADIAPGLAEAFFDFPLTEELSDDLAAELACVDFDGELDSSIPANAGSMYQLLAALMMNPAPLLTTDHEILQTTLDVMQTGAEGAYLDAMLARDEAATFTEAYAIALEATGGNAYAAMMTMHNVGQAIARPGPHVDNWSTESPREKVTTQLLDKMAPLTGMDSRVTDTRGAWYHMAGLAALSMRTGQGMPLLMSTFDEAFYSGIMGGNFELGEQIANMVGSGLGAKLLEMIANRDEDELCDPIVIEITSPADEEVIGDATSVTVAGTVNLDSITSVEITHDGVTYNGIVENKAFSLAIPLGSEDVHTITVSADAVGNRYSEEEVTVRRTAPVWFCSQITSGGGACPVSWKKCSHNNDDMPAIFQSQGVIMEDNLNTCNRYPERFRNYQVTVSPLTTYRNRLDSTTGVRFDNYRASVRYTYEEYNFVLEEWLPKSRYVSQEFTTVHTELSSIEREWQP